jgi:hypothetical protein
MASGDTVLEVDGVPLDLNLFQEGTHPQWFVNFGAASDGAGGEVTLGYNSGVPFGGLIYQYEGGVGDTPPTASPFDPSLTYDIIIKEH